MKKRIVSFCPGDITSIRRAEEEKQELENNGYNLIETIVNDYESKLIYEK